VKTRDRLAAELRKVAAGATYEGNARAYEALAKRAETGEFDDFSSVHPCGPTALWQELMRLGFRKFARRVEEGEFDASLEESEEWARSTEGQAALALLTGPSFH
jgi:hypothetical protein